MSLIAIRRTALTVETILHEGGPAVAMPVRVAVACAAIANPYAGRYEPNLLDFQSQLRTLGTQLARELIGVLGRDRVESYGKGMIVGVDGELEHAAVWHEAGGWAMRSELGDPRAIVPANKAVGSTGYRLMVPLHYIHAAYVRSHFTSAEMGMQDAPRPRELVFGLAMATGPRVHARVGGLRVDQVSVHDGQR